MGLKCSCESSLATAANQGAKFFELRSLRDLVTLHRTHLQSDARALQELSGVLAQIVEGHDLPDFAEAQALL